MLRVRVKRLVGALVVLAVSGLGSVVATAAPTPTWERVTDPAQIEDLAAGADGSVVLALRDLPNPLLRTYANDGSLRWEAAVDASAANVLDVHLAVLVDGSIVVAGRVADFDGLGVTFDPGGAAVTEHGLFVARYLADGSFSWVHGIATNGPQGAYEDRPLQVLALSNGSARVSIEVPGGAATFDALGGPIVRPLTTTAVHVGDYRPDGSIGALVSVAINGLGENWYSFAAGATADGGLLVLAFDRSTQGPEVALRFDAAGGRVGMRVVGALRTTLAAAGEDGSLYADLTIDALCAAVGSATTGTGAARVTPELGLGWLQPLDVTVFAFKPERDGSVDLAGGSSLLHLDATGTITHRADDAAHLFRGAASGGGALYGAASALPVGPPNAPNLVQHVDLPAAALPAPGLAAQQCVPAPTPAPVPTVRAVVAVPSFTG